MIKLTTLCRKIATMFAFATFLFCNCLFSQVVDLPTIEDPLRTDDAPKSVVEKAFGPALPQSPQNELPAPRDAFGNLPENSDDLDILTRGPLHEAFATAHQTNPESSPLVGKAPPELIEEVPPEYKPEGKNVQWIPGYWAWDDSQNDFIWVSGVWRDVPPLRRWVPGYWDPTEQGYRWVSGFWADETLEEIGYLPAPPASIDQGPSTAAPAENYFYLPGNWEYQNNRYRWRSGHWQPTVSNWIWIPARYIWTPNGCIYQSGYWDYEIEYRGTCFAPVYFKRPVYLSTNYCYRPSYTINLNIDFLTHLFVRPHCGHYYYGDWYANNFVNVGYRPWVHYGSHYRNYDPLLTYYRCRRSTVDSRYNVVQYLSQQHRFYANHVNYRPRPTFAAQFNFFNNNKTHHRHSDYLAKSNYVKSYSNVLKTTKRSDLNRQLRTSNTVADRVNREAQRKFRKLQASELRANQNRIDQMAKLQRDRKKNEVKRVANNVKLRTDSKNHHTFKLPPQVSSKQIKKRRNEFAAEKRPENGTRITVEKDRARELKKAVENARKIAAEQERTRRDQKRKLNSELARKQRLDRLAKINGASNTKTPSVTDRSRIRQPKNELSQPKQRQLSRELAKQRDDKKKIIEQKNKRQTDLQLDNRQQVQRRQPLNKSAVNAKSKSTRSTAPTKRQQNLVQQQQRNRQLEQTNQIRQQQLQKSNVAKQLRERQAQADKQRRARENANQIRQRQQQDQKRRADQMRRQQQTQIRRAQQQKAQRDAAALRSQQKAQRDAARRSQQQRRNATKSSRQPKK